jgi:hypothetical protein
VLNLPLHHPGGKERVTPMKVGFHNINVSPKKQAETILNKYHYLTRTSEGLWVENKL